MIFKGSNLKLSVALAFFTLTLAEDVRAQDKTIGELQTAADAGDVSALRDLGEMVVLGRNGATQDIEAGLTLLSRAAEAGDTEAQAILGKLLVEGYVVPADPDRGEALLMQAIAAGHPGAHTTLGLAVLWGVNRDEDPVRAQALLETAADSGDLLAVRVLGQNLLGGWVMDQDIDRGVALLEQAGEADDTKALVSLGKHYLSSGSSARALEYFERAAALGDGEGLKSYGSTLMWSERAPAEAETYLRRAGELGVGSAWTTLATGAMYGYLGRNSRSKFDEFAALARDAGEDRIAVLQAQRQMWGISMTASGPETLAGLEQEASAGNVEAAHYLIRLVRDGNSLNIRRDRDMARDYLERFSNLMTPAEVAQHAFAIDVASTRQTENYPALTAAYHDMSDLKSAAFGQDLYKANPNFAFYVLQSNMRDAGRYGGALNGYATASTLRAVYGECRTLDNPERCNDTVMRADIIGALLAR